MAVSEAKKKSNAKWDSENMATIACRMRKEQADAFKARCAAEGKKANTVVKDFVLSYISGATVDHSGEAVLTPVAAKTAAEAATAAGETIPAFIERAAVTQAKRDEMVRKMGQ